MKTDASSPEKKIKDEIREAYAKTYPNCIFSLTNHIERLKAELTAIETALAAKDEALRMAARLMEQGQYMCLDDDAILDVQEKVGTALSPPTEPKECQWLISELREEGDIWQTDCGHEFVFNEGTPSYNGAKFCLYCGKKLVERVVEENDA